MSTTEATHKEIAGVCVQVEQKPDNDWVTFHIDAGGQHPVRVATKKPELVNAARNVGGQRAVWGFLEKQGKENPNRPGTHYMDRWLDSVTLAVDAAQTTNGDVAETPAMPHPADLPDAPEPKVDWDAKDLRKHRQAAVAIAVSRAAQMTVPSAIDIFALAAEIVDFTYDITRAQPEDLFEGIPIEDVPFGE